MAAVLSFMCVVTPAMAQSQQFDFSFGTVQVDPAQVLKAAASPAAGLKNLPRQLASRPADAVDLARKIGIVPPSPVGSTAATGNVGVSTYNTGQGPMGTGGLVSAKTGRQGVAPAMAWSMVMAPNSVDMSPVPSGSFDYGFPKLGPAPYLGVTASQSNPYSSGGMVPQTSTSAVDINICDMPFIGGRNRGMGGTDSGGAGGGSGSGSGSGGGNTTPVPPYAIGPDWAAVQNSHNGQIMGWMAPGETYEDFFSGRSGHLLPGEDNWIEAQYILNNQLGGLPSSPWGP
jgi:hypothetical protein